MLLILTESHKKQTVNISHKMSWLLRMISADRKAVSSHISLDGIPLSFTRLDDGGKTLSLGFTYQIMKQEQNILIQLISL